MSPESYTIENGLNELFTGPVTGASTDFQRLNQEGLLSKTPVFECIVVSNSR